MEIALEYVAYLLDNQSDNLIAVSKASNILVKYYDQLESITAEQIDEFVSGKKYRFRQLGYYPYLVTFNSDGTMEWQEMLDKGNGSWYIEEDTLVIGNWTYYGEIKKMTDELYVLIADGEYPTVMAEVITE